MHGLGLYHMAWVFLCIRNLVAQLYRVVPDKGVCRLRRIHDFPFLRGLFLLEKGRPEKKIRTKFT